VGHVFQLLLEKEGGRGGDHVPGQEQKDVEEETRARIDVVVSILGEKKTK